jgi:hypothetical protein
MNKIKFSIILLMFLPVYALKAQNIEIELNNKIYPLLTNNGQSVLAASEYSGIYEEGIGLNLREHPLNNNSFSHPEFLVLYHFINMKAGNMEELKKLYDEESASHLSSYINIIQARQAYTDFEDFSLLSKAVFGNYIRLRYNLINTAGQLIPWILIARKIDDRYYLTESMPIEHLFVDISSVNPYNYKREEFENVDVSSIQSVYYSADGLALRVPKNNAFNDLGVYFKIQKFGANPVGDEVELLKDMKQSLQDTADASFIRLWDAENREMLNSSEFYKMQIEVQRKFYNQIDKLEPLGVLNAGNEAVLFYKSTAGEQELPMQLIPMKKENGQYKLTAKLKSYYAWEILNKKDVLTEIEKYLRK